ncbi:MAG TPA: hypothetical protein VMG38_02390, partial [Trebonia sp.]|nr:hypothetical protein [Trebonia sp.]
SVPAGAVLWMAVARALLPGRQPDGVPRLDLAGALLGTLGAAALIFGVAHASPAGWAQPQVIVALCCSMVLIAGFVMVEAKTPVPLVRLGVFREPGVRTGLLVLFCLGATLTPGIFLISLYIQQELGCTAVNAGLALLPMGIVLCLGAPVARRLTAAGMTFLPVAGALITSAGFIVLARLPPNPQVLIWLSLPSLILAAGFVTLTVPVVMMVAAGVPCREAGLVSGLINVSRYVAGAIGVAVLTAIATSHVNSHHLSAFGDAALADFHRAMLTCAIIDVVAALAAATLVFGPARRARQMAGAVDRELSRRLSLPPFL